MTLKQFLMTSTAMRWVMLATAYNEMIDRVAGE